MTLKLLTIDAAWRRKIYIYEWKQHSTWTAKVYTGKVKESGINTKIRERRAEDIMHPGWEPHLYWICEREVSRQTAVDLVCAACLKEASAITINTSYWTTNRKYGSTNPVFVCVCVLDGRVWEGVSLGNPEMGNRMKQEEQGRLRLMSLFALDTFSNSRTNLIQLLFLYCICITISFTIGSPFLPTVCCSVGPW